MPAARSCREFAYIFGPVSMNVIRSKDLLGAVTRILKQVGIWYNNTNKLSTNVKGSINFPIGFVGRKHTVKIIGFVRRCWLWLLAFNLIKPIVKLLKLICFILRNTIISVIFICFEAASPLEGP